MSMDLPPEWAGNISYQVTATAIVCIVFDFGVLTARFISRVLTKSRSGWDDWLLIPAGFFNLAICALILWGPANDGLGQHENAIALQNPGLLALYAKNQLIFICFYIACCIFPKLVLLVLYLRFFTNRGSRIVAWTLMAISIIYGILATAITLTMCTPLAKLWDPTIIEGKCINLPMWFAYSTVPNIVIDAAVLALPIPAVLSLKMPLRDRIGLVLTFSAGGVGTLGGIARTIVNTQINGAMDDVTWTGVPLSIVALVEVTLYLIAACLPGLRPLYLRTRRRGQYSQRSSTYMYDKNGSRRSDYKSGSSMQMSGNSGSVTSTVGRSQSMQGRGSIAPEDLEAYESRYMYAQARSSVGSPPPPAIQVTQSYEVRRLPDGIPFSGMERTIPPRR